MGNMREPIVARIRKKPAKRQEMADPVTIADRLQGFIGQCITTDTPPNTSEKYKEMLRVAIGKKHSR